MDVKLYWYSIGGKIVPACEGKWAETPQQRVRRRQGVRLLLRKVQMPPVMPLKNSGN